MSAKRHRPPPLWHPRLWPTALGLGAARLLALIPVPWQRPLGRALGRAFRVLAPGRRRIARRNLELCFPDRPQSAHTEIERAAFETLGISALETLWTWQAKREANARYRVEGAQHLQAALERGRGVLLLGVHLMTLDAISPALGRLGRIGLIYRYNKNPLIERLMVKGRGRYFDAVFERSDVRPMLRYLDSGGALWYAADQDYGARHSVFADFFGVPAATITALSRLAARRGAAVVPMGQLRDDRTGGWVLRFEPALANFPAPAIESDALERDARRINATLERLIDTAPGEYLWVHRRFKTAPPGTPARYD
ncbi:MAG: lipid A biosynthesis lauroyl acyltransferase [Pseudomonadota bacterium]